MKRKKIISLAISTILILIIFAGCGHSKTDISTNTSKVSNTGDGWIQNGEVWNYYINGSKATGWVLFKDNWYYLNSNGEMEAKKWITVGGKDYYLQFNGALAVNTTTSDGYVVGSDGAWTGEISQSAAAAKAEAAAVSEKAKHAPQKIADSSGKKVWRIYISEGSLHFTGTHTGTGNFRVQLSDSNQNLLKVIESGTGNYEADKTVNVSYEGWYYLEVYSSNGEWSYKFQ